MTLLRQVEGVIQAMEEGKDSLFIACPSYEERSVAVIEKISRKYSVDHAILFLSREYAEKGRSPAHFKLAKEVIQKFCQSEVLTIEFGMDCPLQPMVQFENLCRQWHKLSPFKSITVDVSTFPRQELIVLLRVLEALPGTPRIRLFYTEPGRYATESLGGWLTRGVKSVRTVPGFGGIQHPGKKKLLIMFLGHEDERAAITWKRHQPERLVTISPDPNYRKELDGIVEQTHQLLFTKLAAAHVYPSVPARGIEEAQRAVLDLWERYHEAYFLVVAPLATKLQTLGVYRAARVRPEIQITYAVPSVYNFKSYSEGSGLIWEVWWRLS